MSVLKRPFGTLPDGEAVDLYTIENSSGASVSIQTLGGGIQSLFVPDRNGIQKDVVLGFDSPTPYLNPDYGYQGLLVGRVANRIRDAKFTMDGKTYHLPANQGTWTLHGGGRMSFHNWKVAGAMGDSVTLSFFSPDMEDGFPGNFTMTVTYTFTEDPILRIAYSVLSDQKTVASPTNHTYFNLSADPARTIEDHLLMINADFFTETDGIQLPTGELGEVKNTMMDFTALHKIGDRIDEPFRAIIDGIGYDNNYCLRNHMGEFAQAAVLIDKQSGRKMEVYTDLPGIQLYCGGWLAKDCTEGKGASHVKFRRGVALETQFYPDSVNHPQFPFRYIEANREFKTVTEFRFSVV